LLAAWLHGVAYRTALHARARTVRREHHEREAASMYPAASDADQARNDLRQRLDEELQRLPEVYRAPLVMCYLEGKTNIEAARILGWPPGSMSSRLTRGRELLRDRLAETEEGEGDRKRRKVLPVLLFTSLLTRDFGPTTVPVSLLDSTIQAGLQLTATGTSLVSGAVQALTETSLKTLSASGQRRSRVWLIVAAAVLLMLAASALAWGSNVAGIQSLFGSSGSSHPNSSSGSSTGTCH
jgi:hypothetical protein